jgi:hypothetical protein
MALAAGLLIGLLLACGGVVAYGVLVKGNPTALLPWAHSSSSGTTGNSGTAGSGGAHGAPSVQTFEMPSPAKPTPLPELGVRPIIFLPGIMGSYLSDGTSEVWPNLPGIGTAVECSSQSVDPQRESQVLSSLALTASGAPPPGSTVGVANGVQEPIDGGLGGAITSNSYTKSCGFLLNILSDLVGADRNVTENAYAATAISAADAGYTVVQSDSSQGLSVCQGNPRCFVPVGYDWRLSAETNAPSVLQIIDQVLNITGSDRVDILAHSQGGLEAEAITKMPQSVGKIYRIVTLGTPYLGAAKALTMLLEQTPCEDPPHCFLNRAVVQSLIENFPGVMGLFDPIRGSRAAG